MANGILKVKGTEVVDKDGKPVILRGAGLGGWMNMENFITGFPGHETHMRECMLEVLGEEKYEYFFDRLLYWFFTEEDAKFYKSLGLNSIRVPFNYRHFEDDMNPKVLKQSGFKHLDRVVDVCAKEGIYTILDMHVLPGGQSPGWHADNRTNHPLFWEHKDFQDRTVWLWEELAKHYKGNPWIAGYNLINEPADPKHTRLIAFYERLEKAVRAIDPEHILWLDGNTFAAEWRGFNENTILPNTVYSLHDYSFMGFPTGDRYKGTEEQKDRLRSQFLRKSEFQRKHNTAIWNGEFGPVYADPKHDEDAEAINQERYNLLGEQLRIYDEHKIPWAIWLYKDVGLQGMVHTNPDSPYNKLIAPILEKKKKYQLDSWGKYPSKEVAAVIDPVIEFIDKINPRATDIYPSTWDTRKHVERVVLQMYLADSFAQEYAELFKDKSKEDLEELAKSFSLEQCLKRDGLNKIMSDHAALVQSS
ncbi:Endoglucanase C [Cyphellophora attinorum]|uniref:Endoglucanase C n=1 Tax=Cyphellophora attinorum TaxID=1664694 RepID=A0A0N0NRS1_9EURO|nr:Endoglucanase C [Phialophora attinorum]KPI45421.1 Endoglucanase C [Phialophora attinorum]